MQNQVVSNALTRPDPSYESNGRGEARAGRPTVVPSVQRRRLRGAAPRPPGGVGTILNSGRAHEWVDRRSLALHDAVAAKLEAQPELLDVARANLQRWLRLNPAPALHEWARLLDSLSVPALVGLLRSADERATRLRQSSPFAGFLSAQERQAILNDYESRRT